MTLNITMDGFDRSYTVKRWDRRGAGVTVSVGAPATQFPSRGATVQVELSHDGVSYLSGRYVYQDYVFSGYVDESQALQVSMSDLLFTEEQGVSQ